MSDVSTTAIDMEQIEQAPYPPLLKGWPFIGNVLDMAHDLTDFFVQGLYIATTVSHFLPELYPNPQIFDIERYQKPRNEHRQRGAFAPYGLGAHTCLGAGMAEILMMLTIATLFRKLRLELSPPDYELKLNSAPTPGPEMKFNVRVVGRRP